MPIFTETERDYLREATLKGKLGKPEPAWGAAQSKAQRRKGNPKLKGNNPWQGMSLRDLAMGLEPDQLYGDFQKSAATCDPGVAVATPDSAGPKTGNCYGDAAEAQLFRYRTWTLVHGRPTLQRPPFVQFGHAWLEKGQTVYDAVSKMTLKKKDYYTAGQISKANNLRYSRETARQYMQLTEHYGPWEGVDGTPPTARQKKDWKANGRKLPKKGRRG